MRYWWVNQNQTHRAEVRGNFMWSPKQNANGARNPFYENMRAVSIGDIVFSYWDTRVQAVGVASGTAETGPKPNFGTAGLNWANEGWFVSVDYRRLETQIRPKDHIEVLQPVRHTSMRSRTLRLSVRHLKRVNWTRRSSSAVLSARPSGAK